MFIDEAKIYVRGGDGGNGIVAFHREKFVSRGGPSGGDGGRGGNVYLVTDKQINTLFKFRYKSHFKAKRGDHGQGSRKSGKSADDLFITIPVGTVVKDGASGEVLFDLNIPEQKLLVARGGRGGRGNACFPTATNQSPKRAEKGAIGEEKWIKMELKLLADVGLIGYPNVGKSTLISKISSAKPKIADYPFTTLVPNLGVVELFDFKTAVFADIPGLIEGAHKGLGLGHQFLRHIERTKILLHLLDFSILDKEDILQNYKNIREELFLYNPALSSLPEVVAGNKIDTLHTNEVLEFISENFYNKNIPFYPISAATGQGIKELLKFLSHKLFEFEEKESVIEEKDKNEVFSIPRKIVKGFLIEKKNNKYMVKGDSIEKKVLMSYLDNEECLYLLQKALYKKGIIKALESEGIQNGDSVVIADFEFSYSRDQYKKF